MPFFRKEDDIDFDLDDESDGNGVRAEESLLTAFPENLSADSDLINEIMVDKLLEISTEGEMAKSDGQGEMSTPHSPEEMVTSDAPEGEMSMPHHPEEEMETSNARWINRYV